MGQALPYELILIDDDPEDIELFSLAIENLKFPVRFSFFKGCFEALEALVNRAKGRFPDVVFLDVFMNPVDGFACLKAIKDSEQLAKIPVIIYSHAVNLHQKMKLKTLGAGDILIKPIDMRQLTEYVIRLISERDD